MEPVFSMLGDRTVCVTLSNKISPEVNSLAIRLAQAIETARVRGIGEVQPAYASVAVHFDPEQVRATYVRELVKEALSQAASCQDQELSTPRTIEVPVAYGGEGGPDLTWAADHLGISPEELVRRHTEHTYRVYMIGFTPGFPYLGGMDESIALPRMDEPRKQVPAGSVGIGGNQTGIYPSEAPGGWRLIGHTDISLFSPFAKEPSLLKPGDMVRFVPVSHTTPSGDSREPSGLAAPSRSAPDQDTRDPSFPGLAGPGMAAPTLAVQGLTVEAPGFLTLVVDEGRFGYRHLGVPVSGAADLQSYSLANSLCGNDPNHAALEITLLGPRLRADLDMTIAVTGALATVTVNGGEVPMNRPVFVPAGAEIEVGSLTVGCRCYLAVSGGVSVPQVLGSRSTYLRGAFGGFHGRGLKKGDSLPIGPAPHHQAITCKQAGLPTKTGPARACMPPSPIRQRMSDAEVALRVIAGPECEGERTVHPIPGQTDRQGARLAFPAREGTLDALCRETYTVRPESDRMGLRLEGRRLSVGTGGILSSPVVPGTIQLPPDGRPLLLMCDAQTSGGYPRIACVVSEDLPLAAQLRPGAKVRFTGAT